MAKIEVTIYCDTTGLFSEAECNRDNMCEMMFEESIVEQWFEEKVSPHVDYGFEQWFTEEYTCDDTDGLYDYAVSNGYHPYFNVENQHYVFYIDKSNSKQIVFEGNLNECRVFGMEFGWMWYCDDDEDGYELEVSL